MAVFRYEAIDRAGKVVRGAMNAADEQAVAQRLASMGYALKAVVPAVGYGQSRASVPPPARVSATAPAGFPVSVHPSVSLGALARFYRQLATLVRAGVPIVQALDDLSGTTSNRKLRRACADLKARAQGGDTLSSAMAAYPHLFPVHTVGLIWGGEQGGHLEIALDEAASEIEQEAKDNRYASIGWWVARLSIANLILLVPALDFRGLLVRGLGEASKLSTGVASQVGDPNFIPPDIRPEQVIEGMIRGYWGAFKEVCIPLFVIWIVAAVVWSRLKRVPSVRRVLDALLLAMPGWGGLHRERARERFLKSLHKLYQAGVAPPQAWAVASMSVRNSEISRRLRSGEEMLRHPGVTLQQVFAGSGVFGAEDAGMVATGERAGSVPEVLVRLADYHGDAAAGAKTKGRMISLHALLVPIIAATGYVIVKIVQGYFNFVFDAPRLLGLE